jgi:hypothetical protein
LEHDLAPKLFDEKSISPQVDHALASGTTSSTVFIPKVTISSKVFIPKESKNLKYGIHPQRNYHIYSINPKGTISYMVFIPKELPCVKYSSKRTTSYTSIHTTGNTSSQVFSPNIFMGRKPLHNRCSE